MHTAADAQPASAAAGRPRRRPAPTSADAPMRPALSAKLRLLTFLALSMVVLRHAYNLDLRFADSSLPASDPVVEFIESYLSIDLTWVVIPLFFSISGYLFFRGLAPTMHAILAKWRTRLRTLVLPYLLWSAWGIVLYLVLQHLPGAGPFFVNNRVDGVPVDYVLDRLFIDPIPYQLWFLQALMGCVALAPVLLWLLRRVGAYVLLPLAVLWLLDVNLNPYLRSEAVLFFAFGGLAVMGDLPRPRVPRGVALAALPAWLAAMAALAWVDTVYEPGWHGYVYRALLAPGLAAVWYGYDVYVPRVPRDGLLWRLAALGFFIFAFHEPPLLMVKKLLFRLAGHSAVTDLAFYVLAPAIVVAIAIVVGAALRRGTPRLYGLLTGGR